MVIVSQYNGILQPWHRAKGLELREEADDFVHLYQYGKRVATFGQQDTLIEINKEADKYL